MSKQVNWNRGKDFKWGIMKSILTGISVVDLKQVSIQDRHQAMAYARNYGLDLKDPEIFLLVQNIHIEAIEFIESWFLDSYSEATIPVCVSAPENPLDLLILASGLKEGREKAVQSWACATLKVMHCYFQLEHDLKLKNINAIRRQIFKGYESIICTRDEAIFLEDDQESLPLYFFKFKRSKDRGRIILKLLHKRSHVPSDIYDHLGIRFVLNTKAECLLALDFLWRHNLINEANIKPSRSKNTLVNLVEARRLFKKYREEIDQSEDYPTEIYKLMDRELEKVKPDLSSRTNPFSDHDYRSMQITIRKMITLEDEPSSLAKGLNRSPESHKFYFDYEIQLIDKETWLKTRRGPTSHEAYKKRQVNVARKRVFGPWLFQHLETQVTGEKV